MAKPSSSFVIWDSLLAEGVCHRNCSAPCTAITGWYRNKQQKKKEKQKHVYRYKFTALNFGVGVSSCGRNFFFFFFLMEANENKRHSASPWESAGAMPKEPGNHNGVSRHKRLAYPSEYSRWCPSHLCCASYILAPAHTDERGGGRRNPKWFPCVSNFFYFRKATGAVY